LISELPSYLEDESQEFINFEEILRNEDIYQNNKALKNTNLKLLALSTKRRYLFDCLKQSFLIYKHKWAYSTISNLLKKLYREQDRFSSNEYKEIENMIDIMNNKITSGVSLDVNRIIRDNKIKDNALQASHNVSDSRAERIVTGDAWQTKQAGLHSKMHINN
jgi:hypothetical protein